MDITVDHSGRIQIPKAIRSKLKINFRDTVIMQVENSSIVITKKNLGCRICGGSEELHTIDGLTLCGDCITKLKTIL